MTDVKVCTNRSISIQTVYTHTCVKINIIIKKEMGEVHTSAVGLSSIFKKSFCCLQNRRSPKTF